MKTLLRLGFVALIVSCVVIQDVNARRGRTAADAAPDLNHALEIMDVRITGSTDVGISIAHYSSCPDPIHLAYARADGTDDDTLQMEGLPRARVIYVYLGSVLERRNNTEIFIRWLRARALFIAGLTSRDPPRYLAMIALPLDCPGLANLDWAALSPS